uniref:Putative metalloserrulase n=1 Tax=Megacormus gertschi TaxID=1843536 RepID=A0A224X3R5_9SCOR
MFLVSIEILIWMFSLFLPAILTEDENYISKATAEILVIMEKNFSDGFASSYQRQSHVCNLFKEVNTIFQMSGIRLSIVLKGLKMINNLEDQPFVEDNVVKLRNKIFLKEDCICAFNDFSMKQTWIKEYDAVILLTKRSLTDGTNYISGLAFSSGLCKDRKKTAVALPESRVIAHEIAHMLGVEHDNFYYENKTMPFYYDCSPDERYIMGHYYKNQPEWNMRFSPCSVDVFKSNLKKGKGYDCLWRTNVMDTARCKPPRIACNMQTLQGSRSGCTNIDGIIKQIS